MTREWLVQSSLENRDNIDSINIDHLTLHKVHGVMTPSKKHRKSGSMLSAVGSGKSLETLRILYIEISAKDTH